MGSLCCHNSDNVSSQEFRDSLQIGDVVTIRGENQTQCAKVDYIHRGWTVKNYSRISSSKANTVFALRSMHGWMSNELYQSTDNNILPFRSVSCGVHGCSNSILSGQALIDAQTREASKRIPIPFSLHEDNVLAITIAKHGLFNRLITTLTEVPYDPLINSHMTMVVNGVLSASLKVDGCNFVLNHESSDLKLVAPWQLRQQIESIYDAAARLLDLNHCKKLLIDLPQALARSRQALEEAKKEEDVELSQLGALLLEIDRIQHEIEALQQKLPQLEIPRVTEIRIIRPFIKLHDGMNLVKGQAVHIFRNLTVEQRQTIEKPTAVIDYDQNH